MDTVEEVLWVPPPWAAAPTPPPSPPGEPVGVEMKEGECWVEGVDWGV